MFWFPLALNMLRSSFAGYRRKMRRTSNPIERKLSMERMAMVFRSEDNQPEVAARLLKPNRIASVRVIFRFVRNIVMATLRR